MIIISKSIALNLLRSYYFESVYQKTFPDTGVEGSPAVAEGGESPGGAEGGDGGITVAEEPQSEQFDFEVDPEGATAKRLTRKEGNKYLLILKEPLHIG
jgi:hypothetical protein